MERRNLAAIFVVVTVVFGISACNIHVDKNKDGKDKNVEINTPLGNLSVHKNANPKDTGIDLYTNAKPKEGSDHDSANVNIAGPGFGLKVVAATFTSDDAPDKVLSYYRDHFKKRFGSSLECRGNYGDVNTDHKGKNLDRPVSCESQRHGSSDTIELKAGTEGNQHIVAIKPDGKGTEFKLVYVRMNTAGTKDSDDAI